MLVWISFKFKINSVSDSCKIPVSFLLFSVLPSTRQHRKRYKTIEQESSSTRSFILSAVHLHLHWMMLARCCVPKSCSSFERGLVVKLVLLQSAHSLRSSALWLHKTRFRLRIVVIVAAVSVAHSLHASIYVFNSCVLLNSDIELIWSFSAVVFNLLVPAFL